ncbi:tetratricopeptide repeat protein [Lysobacter terrestris]|uniref:Tetratricopeptide repeat protein n=2 Tax=Agrilutibacter terrestris TaxID=2865112 RepID=A0A7H0G166_9GAMM|nr:tetratricopeptide repeat protein [Lysobacter terrestris]
MIASIAIVAGLLYLLVGTPRALDPAQRRAPDTLADAVGQLEAELRRNPNQPEGWRLLARSQAAQGRVVEARDAYARAVQLAPEEPDLLAEAAEARALASPDRRFDDEAVALLRRALAKQPMHQRARWFLGIAQRQAQQPAEAAKTWEPLLGLVDAATADSLRAQINAARAEAGLTALPVPATAKPLLRVTVDLAPEMQARLGANDTLFVIARQPNGPPMPVAVKRVAATGFPITVELGDGDSPMPTMKLSQLAAVEILARVSRQGVANRAAGDLESAPLPAQPKAGAAYTLSIDRIAE